VTFCSHLATGVFSCPQETVPAARDQYLVPSLACDTGPVPAFRYDPLKALPLLLPISGPSGISSVDLLSLHNYDQIAPPASSPVLITPSPQSPPSGGHLLQSPSMLLESVHSGPDCTNHPYLLYPTSTTSVSNWIDPCASRSLEDLWPPAWGYPVPQLPYEQRGWDKNVRLKDPILFRMNGVFGISLRDALERKYTELDERDTEMVIGCRSSVSVRISWCGYKPWVEQIKTHDGRKIPRRDTKEKLATKIARLIKRFMEENRDAVFAGIDPSWCLKSDHITLDNLHLVGLIHRSKSSWQPFLVFRPRSSA